MQINCSQCRRFAIWAQVKNNKSSFCHLGGWKSAFWFQFLHCHCRYLPSASGLQTSVNGLSEYNPHITISFHWGYESEQDQYCEEGQKIHMNKNIISQLFLSDFKYFLLTCAIFCSNVWTIQFYFFPVWRTIFHLCKTLPRFTRPQYWHKNLQCEHEKQMPEI